MKTTPLALMSLAALAASAADVTYETKPASEPIAVSGGVSTFRGACLADNLIGYWPFDDAADMGRDASGRGMNLSWCAGGANRVVYDAPAASTLSATNEMVRGGASAAFKSGYSGVVTNVPAALDGTKPFTVCCWFRVNPDAVETGTSTAYGLFGLGNATNTTATSSMTLRLAASDNKNQTTLQTITFGSAVTGAGSFGASLIGYDSFKEAGWVHVAMTYVPNADGVTASSACIVNGGKDKDGNPGTTRYGNYVQRIDSTTEPENYVLFVGACRYSPYFRSIPRDNVLIDEPMVFDKALTVDEVAWVMDHTRPADFAAQWEVSATGVLNLAGSTCLQDVFGSGGAVTSPTAMRIGSEEDRWFSGAFDGAGDVVLSPTRTMLLTGANAHDGKTVVASGTVALLSSGTDELKTAFGENLRAYWNFDGLGEGWAYDWSGNDMTLREARQSWATDCSYIAGTSGEAAHTARGLEHRLGLEIGQDPTLDSHKSDNSLVPKASIPGFNDNADNSYTISLWAKTAADATSRSGFLRMDDATSGMRFGDSPNSSANVLFGHKNDKYLSAAVTKKEGEAQIGGGDWHHFVLTYDRSDTENRIYRLYIDNELKVTQMGTNVAERIKNFGTSSRLRLGLGLENAKGRTWHGWLDECIVLNRPVTTEEVALLYGHRATTPAAATGILPTTTDLQIDSGATAALDLVNETVAALSGAGTLSLSAKACLSVTDRVAFTGTVSGEGRLNLGEGLVFATPEPPVANGTYVFLTAPTACVKMPEDISGWTLADADRLVVRFAQVDNGDGTSSVVAKAFPRGMFLFLR